MAAVGLVVEYWTRKRQAAGSTLTLSTASNLEQDANLLWAQATQPPTLSGTGNEQLLSYCGLRGECNVM